LNNLTDSLSPLPWIGLAGPTASGKTALALALAQRFPFEIVSVDSALVYKDLDIGAAKPTPAERALVRHHLIDVIDAAESYSAARFVTEAQAAMRDIHARGKWPLLVGGTMLYYKALIDGISPLPAADAALRAQLDQEAAKIGWPEMHAQLAHIDPETAARLTPFDAQRIQRALEVWRLTGQPLSSHFKTPDAGGAPWPPALLLSLEPEDRSALHQRINQRFALMLENGLIEEVVQFRARGDLHLGLPSMRCVGYRQVWEALDEFGPSAQWTPAQRHIVQERGSAATRQLAKRQLTWLRSMANKQVLVSKEFTNFKNDTEENQRVFQEAEKTIRLHL
jgi:tRNA dimethylallyltransferase